MKCSHKNFYVHFADLADLKGERVKNRRNHPIRAILSDSRCAVVAILCRWFDSMFHFSPLLLVDSTLSRQRGTFLRQHFLSYTDA